MPEEHEHADPEEAPVTPPPPVRPYSRRANRLIPLITRTAIGVLMLVVAVGIFGALQASKPVIEAVDPTSSRQPVIVFEAARVPVQRQWRGYGTAEALDTADVPARVTATVESIPADVLPGARVTRGQLLVQLDKSDFDRQLEIAKQRIAELDAALSQLDVEEKRIADRLALEASDVAVARSDFDRQTRFRERNVGNQQDLDNAQRNLINAQRSQLLTQQEADLIGPRRRSLEAQKASQQSQVNLAELSQQRTTVLSPIDGVIQAINVEVGENLTAGQTIARVVAPSPVEVPIQLPASALGSVGVGDGVNLRPTSGAVSLIDRAGWSTSLSRINPAQDPMTRTLTVYADLSADDGSKLLPVPGMFLEAIVSVARSDERFVVPRRSIRQGRVQVVRNGEVISRPVDVLFNLSGPQPKFGLNDEQWAVVGDSLNDGDLVVVNAASQIADGTLVEPRVASVSTPHASKQTIPNAVKIPGAAEVPGGVTP
ncbi:MAG: efflux RND transporter periplasmic adaptor subunit [Planctomycetota bacterium]